MYNESLKLLREESLFYLILLIWVVGIIILLFNMYHYHQDLSIQTTEIISRLNATRGI